MNNYPMADVKSKLKNYRDNTYYTRLYTKILSSRFNDESNALDWLLTNELLANELSSSTRIDCVTGLNFEREIVGLSKSTYKIIELGLRLDKDLLPEGMRKEIAEEIESINKELAGVK